MLPKRLIVFASHTQLKGFDLEDKVNNLHMKLIHPHVPARTEFQSCSYFQALKEKKIQKRMQHKNVKAILKMWQIGP